MRWFLPVALLIPLSLFGQLPESIVKDRSLVIMDLPLEKSDEFLLRGDWKEQSDEIQKMLRLVNVDVIGYLHNDDWEASKDVQLSYKLFFATRSVKHLIRIKQANRLYNLSIHDAASQNLLWETEGGSIRQTVIRLGNEIKKRNFEIENFLPVDQAEVFVDIPFARTTAASNFPDRIRRFTVGIAQFDDDRKNQQLRELLINYPFEYEIFEYKDDEDAFRQGYQYIILNLTTAGSTIHQLLNLNKSIIDETAFISTTKGDSSTVNFKTIPAEARVTKFYIKQTVNKEIYVGKNWDADTSWQKALDNFIHNMNIAFRKI